MKVRKKKYILKTFYTIIPVQLINKFLEKHEESINIIKVKDRLKQTEK